MESKMHPEAGKFDKNVDVIGTDTVQDTDSGENYFEGYIGDEHASRSYKEQKFIVLYKCRHLLSKIGTMEERRICAKMLKKMKNKGLNTI